MYRSIPELGCRGAGRGGALGVAGGAQRIILCLNGSRVGEERG